MAITLITGVPGAGKSHFCVALIRDLVRDGKVVFTNVVGLKVDRFDGPGEIVMIDDAWVLRFIEAMPETDKDPMPTDIMPENSALVMDEALNYFSKARIPVTSPLFRKVEPWLRMHRHYGYELYFVAQHLMELCLPVRRYSDVSILLRNMGYLGFRNWYTISRFETPEHLQRRSKAFSVSRKKYDPEVFQLYESVNASSDLVSVRETPLWRRPILLVPIALLLSMPIIISNFSAFQSSSDVQAKVPASQSSVVPVARADTPSSSEVAVNHSFFKGPTVTKTPPSILQGSIIAGDKCILVVQRPTGERENIRPDNKTITCRLGYVGIINPDSTVTRIEVGQALPAGI